MSSNNQDENFKLVSLDGSSTIKPSAQRARQAYSSYLKDDDDSSSSSGSGLTISESTEEEEAPAPPPQKPVSTAPKKGTQQLKSSPAKGTQQLKQQNTSGKKYQVDEDGPDYFSEDKNKTEDVGVKIDELKQSISSLWNNLVNTVSATLLKLGTILMKPFVLIANILTKVLSIPLNIINRVVSSLANKVGVSSESNTAEQVEEEAPPPEMKMANFNDMIELNIIFLDNYKKNLYNKPKQNSFKLSKAEENLINGLAIEAIKECAEFTMELPPPSEGIYQGIPISKVMEEVSEQDVAIFLGFVKAFPGKYIGKTWKISETFATWLINNAPTG
jgi:hypothetical protein